MESRNKNKKFEQDVAEKRFDLNDNTTVIDGKAAPNDEVYLDLDYDDLNLNVEVMKLDGEPSAPVNAAPEEGPRIWRNPGGSDETLNLVGEPLEKHDQVAADLPPELSSINDEVVNASPDDGDWPDYEDEPEEPAVDDEIDDYGEEHDDGAFSDHESAGDYFADEPPEPLSDQPEYPGLKGGGGGGSSKVWAGVLALIILLAATWFIFIKNDPKTPETPLASQTASGSLTGDLTSEANKIPGSADFSPSLGVDHEAILAGLNPEGGAAEAQPSRGGNAPTGGSKGGVKPETPAGGSKGSVKPEAPAGGSKGGVKPEIPAVGSKGGVKPEIPAGGSKGGVKPEAPAVGSKGSVKPEIPAGGSRGGVKPETPAGGSRGGVKPEAPAVGSRGGVKPETPAVGSKGDVKPETPAVGNKGGVKPDAPAGDGVKPEAQATARQAEDDKISNVWVVNISSTPDAGESMRVLSQVVGRDVGGTLYTYEAAIKGVLHHRVRVGFFKTKADAELAAKRLSETYKLGATPWVVQPTVSEVNRHMTGEQK